MYARKLVLLRGNQSQGNTECCVQSASHEQWSPVPHFTTDTTWMAISQYISRIVPFCVYPYLPFNSLTRPSRMVQIGLKMPQNYTLLTRLHTPQWHRTQNPVIETPKLKTVVEGRKMSVWEVISLVRHSMMHRNPQILGICQ